MGRILLVIFQDGEDWYAPPSEAEQLFAQVCISWLAFLWDMLQGFVG
jgi:hypothetical protein